MTNSVEVGQRPFDLPQLPVNEVEYTRARDTARPPDRDDLLDLVQVESEPACLSHEREDLQRVLPVEPIPRGRATRCGKNARRLVKSKRLSADSAACRHLADQETVPGHDLSVNPSPGGKVKSLLGALRLDRAASQWSSPAFLARPHRRALTADCLCGTPRTPPSSPRR